MQNIEAAVIGDCLARIRARLLVVRTAERATIALLWAAPVGADLALAKYLSVRYPAYAVVVALLPAALVGAFWLGRLRYAALRRVRLAFDIRVGSVLTVVLAGAALAAISSTNLAMWLYCAAPLAAFGLAAVAMGRVVSPQVAAIFVDQQAGLRERVSTAYELMNRPATNADEAAFHAPLLAAAAEACRDVRRAKVGYARLDRRVYLASAVCVAAAIGVAFMEPLPALGGRGPARRVDARVATAADSLAATLDKLAKERSAKDPAADAALVPIDRLIPALKAGDISQLDAKRAMMDADREYKAMLDRYSASDKAHEAMKRDDMLSGLAKAAEEYKKALEGSKKGEAGAAEAKDQAERKLAAEAKKTADGLAGLSAGEREKLDKALKTAEESAKGNTNLEKKLAEARSAAAAGDGKKMGEALKDVGGEAGAGMEEGRANAKAVKDAIDAIEKAGGSLAGGDNKSGGENGSGQEGGANKGGNPQANSGTGQSGTGQSGAGQSGKGESGTSGKQGGQTAGGNKGSEGTGNSGMGSGDSGMATNDPEAGSTPFYNPGGGDTDSHIKKIGGTGTVVRMYEPKEVATAGQTDRVNGNLDKTGTPSGKIEVSGAGDRSEAPLVPYEQVLESTRKEAMEAVESGKIPPQYRDVVRAMYGK